MELVLDMKKKRKHGVDKKIVMFLNNVIGTKCAEIFEFDIKLSTNSVGEVVIKSDYCEGQLLKPTESFYDQRLCVRFSNRLIRSVGACLVSGSSELYMFPDDGGEESTYPMSVGATDSKYVDKKHTLKPLVYDILTKKTITNNNLGLVTPSYARKMGPIVALVGMEIFVLSAFYDPWIMAPEPSFEAFCLHTRTWRNLASSPINSTRSVQHAYSVTGYAVLGEDFLLVSLSWGHDRLIYYTYSFRSNVWKDTNAPVFMDDAPVLCCHGPCLNNQALVIGHDIYNFHPASLELVVFSYTECGVSTVADYDIMLGPATLVQGIHFTHDFIFPRDPHYIRTTAIVKVEDDIYCLFLTLSPSLSDPIQGVHVLFIQLQGRDLCKTIQSFTCTLCANNSSIYGLSLASCHAMDAVKSDQQRGKRAFNDADDEASERDCGFTGERMEAALVEAAALGERMEAA